MQLSISDQYSNLGSPPFLRYDDLSVKSAHFFYPTFSTTNVPLQ